MYVPEEIVEKLQPHQSNFEGTDTSDRWQLVPDLQGLSGYYQLSNWKISI
jgi:hypothetical protein